MTDPPKKNRGERRREAKEARLQEAREAKAKAKAKAQADAQAAQAAQAARLQTSSTQVDCDNLCFEHLRMGSTDESIAYGFAIQRAMATHGQPMLEPDASHEQYIQDCHERLDALLEEGIDMHEIPDERREIIHELYQYLRIMENNSLLAVSAVYTYRGELSQCSFAELVMILGPVKAEWFGRALAVVEGDPTVLIGKKLKAPPCGGCGSHPDKPVPEADLENSSVGEAGDSGSKCPIAIRKMEEAHGKMQMEEYSRWIDSHDPKQGELTWDVVRKGLAIHGIIK